MKLKDIEQMQSAGLISPEQATAIAEHFKLSGNRLQWWLLFSVSALAGALILGGIIMLISANWESIPSAVKMGCGIALMVGFWAAYACLRDKYPILAENMGLLGGGMWLANIALYGQIFQLQNPFVEGCALFFCGIVLLPFLTRQRLLIGVVIITSYILLSELCTDRDSPLHLPLTTDEMLNCMMLLTVCWWLFAEFCRSSQRAIHSYVWVGYGLSGFAIVAAQGFILYGEGFNATPIELGTTGAALLLLLVFKPKNAARLPWILFALMTAGIIPAADFFNNFGEWTLRWGDSSWSGVELALPRILYCFIYALLWIWNGCCARRIDWINYGSIMVCFAGIGVMSNMMESLTESGLVLIFAGLLMLAGAIVLEKQRRRLISTIKAESTKTN